MERTLRNIINLEWILAGIMRSVFRITMLVILLLIPDTAFSHDTRMMGMFGGEENPGEADLFLYRGNAFAQNGEFERAIEEYTQAINLRPYFYMAYLNRGLTFLDLGKPERALADLDLAVGIEPNEYEIYINRGLVFDALKDSKSAIIECDRAIELDSMQAEAYANRGKYLSDLGRLEEGLVECGKAIAIDSIYAPAWFGSTLIHIQLGNKAEAARTFKRLVELNPPEFVGLIEQLSPYIDTTVVE